MGTKEMILAELDRRIVALESLRARISEASQREFAEIVVGGFLTSSDLGDNLAIHRDQAQPSRLNRPKKLASGELDRGVRKAVAEMPGEFSWRQIHGWLTDNGIIMSARQPYKVLTEKFRSMMDEGIIERTEEGGPGRPSLYHRVGGTENESLGS